jgi:hypothetical protein
MNGPQKRRTTLASVDLGETTAGLFTVTAISGRAVAPAGLQTMVSAKQGSGCCGWLCGTREQGAQRYCFQGKEHSEFWQALLAACCRHESPKALLRSEL